MRALIGFLIACLITSSLMGKDQSGNFSAAQDAFGQGDFASAAKIYLDAIQDGQANASLFYNLGDSLYKNGELGASMAAFLRARALAPNDPDIRYNLHFLQEKTKDKLESQLQDQTWSRLSAARWLGERPLFWLAAVAFCLALVCFGWQLLSARFVVFGWVLGALFFVSSLYPALSLAEKLWRTPDWGAIVSAEVDVLASPTTKGAVVIFQLHEGAPFAVLNQSGDWFKIQLSDGKTGWLQGENVAIFGKKYFSYKTAKGDGKSSKLSL